MAYSRKEGWVLDARGLVFQEFGYKWNVLPLSSLGTVIEFLFGMTLGSIIQLLASDFLGFIELLNCKMDWFQAIGMVIHCLGLFTLEDCLKKTKFWIFSSLFMVYQAKKWGIYQLLESGNWRLLEILQSTRFSNNWRQLKLWINLFTIWKSNSPKRIKVLIWIICYMDH